MEHHIYISDTLSEMLKDFTPKEKEIVFNMYKHYENEYFKALSSNDPVSVIYTFHVEMDESITKKFAADPESKKITCKKGCYYCCQQNVDISMHEAILLVRIMHDDNIKIDKEKLKRQAKYNAETWHDQPEEDWSCIFLKEDKSCAVYEHRPATCRKYFVISRPNLCDTKKRHQLVERFVCLVPEILGSVIFNQPLSGSLPKILYNAYKIINDEP